MVKRNIEVAESSVILFDGVCNLCNGIVQFIIKRDPKGKFRFASLQSECGQKLLGKFGLPSDEFDSIVLIKGEQYFLKSTAGLRILKELGGLWKLLLVFTYLPAPFRDFIYDQIARSRYRIFGKRESCMIPTPELKARFLE
jgi:predicted DCC family thiol-disulfide oxidoreductase YuxK